MKSKQSKILKGKSLKQHIQKLYLERLNSDTIFNDCERTQSKLKILSRKVADPIHFGENTVSEFIETQKSKFIAQQQAQLGKITKSINENTSSILSIKKITRAVNRSRFTILPKPKFVL